MKRVFSFPRLMKSFVYAGQGIRWVFQGEPNFKIHLLFTAAVLGLGFYFRISAGEWIAVVFSIGTVLIAETFNTSIEFLADAVHPEKSDLVGKAKDTSAGAVLFAAATATAVGAIVFLPKIWDLIQKLTHPDG